MIIYFMTSWSQTEIILSYKTHCRVVLVGEFNNHAVSPAYLWCITFMFDALEKTIGQLVAAVNIDVGCKNKSFSNHIECYSAGKNQIIMAFDGKCSSWFDYP